VPLARGGQFCEGPSYRRGVQARPAAKEPGCRDGHRAAREQVARDLYSARCWGHAASSRKRAFQASEKDLRNAINGRPQTRVALLLVAVRFLLLERLVLLHFLVIRAEIFQQVFVTKRPDTRGGGPRLCQYFGVLDGHLHGEIIQ
jgi:hypothetical protein